MGNNGGKVSGADTSTTNLASPTPSSSEGKHTDEFKFFDKALKVFDSEKKTKIRRKFRDLVRESKTATIKWQQLPELYDENTEKWKYNYFNALKSVIKTVMIAFDNGNPIANYEYITNLINLVTLVIDFRKTQIKIQERKRVHVKQAQKLAVAEWIHAQKKLQSLLNPNKEPKDSNNKSDGEEEEAGQSNGKFSNGKKKHGTQPSEVSTKPQG